MSLDKNRIAIFLFLEFAYQDIHSLERASVCFDPHEISTQHSSDPQTKAVFFNDYIATPGITLGQIGRAADPFQSLDFVLKVLLIPNVIPKRDGVYPCRKQLLCNLRSQTGTPGGILRVGDHTVRSQFGTWLRQTLPNKAATGATDDIS